MHNFIEYLESSGNESYLRIAYHLKRLRFNKNYRYLMNPDIWNWCQRTPRMCLPTKVSKSHQSKLEYITKDMIMYQEKQLLKDKIICKKLDDHSICELKSLIMSLHPRGIIDRPVGNRKNIKEVLIKKVARVTSHYMETKWGNELIGITNPKQYTGNWTTKLGESFVKEVCKILGMNPKKILHKQDPDNLIIKPDVETNRFIIEVKTSNWTMPGTAGEKILGTPYKYISVPEIYGKPLKIICVGYQIEEAKKWGLFGKSKSELRNNLIMFYKKMGIEFIPISFLLSQVKKRFPEKFSHYP